MLTLLVGLHQALSGIVPTLQIIVTAEFINTTLAIVQSGASIERIYSSIALVVAMIAYTWVSGELMKFVQVKLNNRMREYLRTEIVDKRARLAFHHVENHATYDTISRVSEAPESRILGAYNNILSFIALIVQVAGILLLLIAQVWWAVLLITAISVPLFAMAIKSGKANYQASREVSNLRRKNEYLSEVLTSRETSDERTLFGFGNKLNETWYGQYESARITELKTQQKWFIKMKFGSILTALISVSIIVILLKPVLSGQLSIGMFISLVNAVFGLVGMMSWNLTYKVDQLSNDREYAKDLTEFAALEEVDGAASLPASPSPVFDSLEFHQVSFQYPGTEQWVLDKMSFRITAGEHCSFVGMNGAGKTTITKLLTGLYDNYEGNIYLNGRNLREFNQSELKGFFSVVYQDFAKFYISFEDNIALGNVKSHKQDYFVEKIDQAIHTMALTQVEARLPLGRKTPLGKIVDGGQDLSGGEWQRLAMARAIVNPAPVRILDEPTAALDPLSESRLYREFEQISRERTTLYISHRLGSTKLATTIFVIGEGRVMEQGSHEQLMRFGGVYAQMYESQRSWYDEKTS